MSCLVIGVGNTDRGDDGAGLKLVELLDVVSAGRLDTACCRGDLTELLELWANHERVIVADMITKAGAAPGEVYWFDVVQQSLPYDVSCSSHSISLAQAIELARQLDSLPQNLQVVGIVGADISLGGRLSPPVSAAVQALAQQLQQENFAVGQQHA